MHKEKEVKTDINLFYMLPMTPIGSPYDSKTVRAKVVKVNNATIYLRAVEDPNGYEQLSFYDEYFQWLLQSHYAWVADDQNDIDQTQIKLEI